MISVFVKDILFKAYLVKALRFFSNLFSFSSHLNCIKLSFFTKNHFGNTKAYRFLEFVVFPSRENKQESLKSSHLSTSQRGSFILLKSTYESKQVAAILFMHKTPKGTIYIFYSFLRLIFVS